ncbi:hypothetical protein [Silvanigrella aquatica]|uniref:Uncharacterized protein n=1 Tax=Silvanigrella aquatica TaxID=1915309 RepID=A0A1L4D147_9BACT|nr:hypothetical protein [Silvanigrella aquatica]APJ03918.1 hypothetical protein AXG55_08375 [Silvanigrella aquatica]
MNLKLNSNKKKIHDLHAAIRFLDNLYNEINIAKSLEEIQDPLILKKLHEVIHTLKNEIGY